MYLGKASPDEDSTCNLFLAEIEGYSLCLGRSQPHTMSRRESTAAHPDFDQPWCKKILADPNLKFIKQTHEQKTPGVTNSMFEYTLLSDRGIRAHLSFTRQCHELEAIQPWEACFLISIGDGLDGRTGRAHGGFNSLILDHISGLCAYQANPSDLTPATAHLATDYKAPVSTPCVILARGWLIELSGRKVWVRGVIEDSNGMVLASSKALFVSAKQPQKL